MGVAPCFGCVLWSMFGDDRVRMKDVRSIRRNSERGTNCWSLGLSTVVARIGALDGDGVGPCVMRVAWRLGEVHILAGIENGRGLIGSGAVLRHAVVI